MRRFGSSIVLALSSLLLISISSAQQTSTTAVPNLIRYNGTLNDAQGTASVPHTTVGVTFAIYKQQDGGAPLWQETQNVTPDANGQYYVLLGSTKTDGVPAELFSDQEQRWLGVQVEGQPEQARVLMVSVPYAFKAHEAETLGGLPASAFMQANPGGVPGIAAKAAPNAAASLSQAGGASATTQSPITGSGTKNFVPIWTSSSALGNSALFQTGGNVGLGTTTPGARLEVVANPANSSSVGGIRGTGASYGLSGNATAGSGNGVFGDATATSGFANGVSGQTASPGGAGVYAVNLASSGGVGVNGTANATSGPATGVTGRSASTSGNGVSAQTASPGGAGVFATNLASSGGIGVNGSSNATSGPAAGVQGRSASTSGNGVFGDATATSGYTNGVYGQSASISGTGVNGYAFATSGSTVAILGLVESPNGIAGRFTTHSGSGLLLQGTSGGSFRQVFYVDASGNGFFGGNLNVTGNLTKGSGSFKIDHPLDPANKYLSHSFVESPDMMDVYNGNVTTDKRGRALVALPDYFQSLNRDFRYQLTVIGQFAQAIVAKEISDNRFTIKTNKPGVKVSWQVTGIRQDAFANVHRIPVEEQKPEQERGTYLHPDVFASSSDKNMSAQLH